MAEDAAKGALAARVNFGSCDGHAIAGNHDDGIRHGLADGTFRDREDDDDATFLAVFLEGLCSEAFARFGPLQIMVGDAHALLPTRIEDGGFQSGASRGVRIGFGGDIQAALLRSVNYIEKARRFAHAHAGDVDHVNRRPGSGTIRNNFLERGESSGWFEKAVVAEVHVDGGSVSRSNFEDIHDFRVGGGRSVVDPHADGERAVFQALVDRRRDFLNLFGSGFAVGRVADWQKCAGIVHHLHADGYVTDAGAKVDERVAFAFGVPGINVGDAGFKFKGGGDTVVGLEFVVAGFLAVFMHVNKTGGNDHAAGVDGLVALERRLR